VTFRKFDNLMHLINGNNKEIKEAKVEAKKKAAKEKERQ